MQHRKPATTSDTLQVPSQQSATSSVRHLSPQRSTRGATSRRGRPRNAPPVPKPTPKEQLHAHLRRTDVRIGLVLFGVLVLALIVSALRIASHSNEVQYIPIAPKQPPSPIVKQRATEAADAPSASNSNSAPSSSNEINFDDVVTEILAETWDLPKDEALDVVQSEEGYEQGEAAPPRRSYEELMAEMEGLGVSVEDLTAALNAAYNES